MPYRWLCAAVALVLALGPVGAAVDENTPARVMKVLRDYVQANPQHQLVSVGSWVIGGYKPGLSDCDIRLIVGSGSSDDAARAAWRSCRQDLVRRLTLEFNRDGLVTVEQVLAKTNLYSPHQLMTGVLDASDAARRCIHLGQVPSFGFRGAITPDIDRKFVEGLFGEGAMANIQWKELGEGRVVYAQGNRVFTGRLDLTHMAETHAKFTPGGTANTAYQWAGHALDALKERDSRAVLKYLERLEADIRKGRDLARLAGESPIQGRLRDLMARLRANPAGALALYGDDIAGALHRAQLEASIMRQLGRGSGVGEMIARVLLEGRQGASRLWNALSKATENFPAGQVIDGVFKAWMAHGALMSAGEGDMLRTYTGTLGALGLSLSGAIVLELMAGTLEAARAGGHDMVASTQDASDLIAGIYTGVGRAGVDDRAYTLDQLLERFWLEEHLRSFVYARCVAAAQRDFGKYCNRSDMDTAEAIFEKCYPVILRAWQSRREMLAMEFGEQFDQLAKDMLLVAYAPIPAQLKDGKVEVTAWPTTGSGVQGKRMERFRAILRALMGPKARIYANVYNTWTPTGRDLARSDEAVTYTFTTPGKHFIKLQQRVAVGVSNVPLNCPLVKEVTRDTEVEITVAGPDDGTGKPPAFAAVSSVPINAVVYRENKRIAFRLNGQISADVPLEGGRGLTDGQDLSLWANDEDTRYAGRVHCLAPVGKTAHVSLAITATGGGNYSSGKDRYVYTVKSVKYALVEASAGFPAALTEGIVTFTPRNASDSAEVQLIVEVKATHIWDDGHESEMGGTAAAPLKIRLLLVGSK